MILKGPYVKSRRPENRAQKKRETGEVPPPIRVEWIKYVYGRGTRRDPCGRPGLLDELVFHGVAGGCGPGRDLDFAVDRGQVAIDGARTDD